MQYLLAGRIHFKLGLVPDIGPFYCSCWGSNRNVKGILTLIYEKQDGVKRYSLKDGARGPVEASSVLDDVRNETTGVYLSLYNDESALAGWRGSGNDLNAWANLL